MTGAVYRSTQAQGRFQEPMVARQFVELYFTSSQSSERSAAQITNSSFKTPSAFHPSAQRNAFRRRDVRLQSRSFGRWNQSLRHSHNSIQPQLPYALRISTQTSLGNRIVDKQQRAVHSSSLLLHKIELEFVLIVTQMWRP